MFSSTIFALATGYTKSAISVVFGLKAKVIRISGPEASKAIDNFTKKKRNYEHRKTYLSHFYDPETRKEVDKGILVCFNSPNSYTGEDMVEFHIHGGVANVDYFLLKLSRIDNFRMAEAVRRY